jgi:hypothetical protein
MNERNSQWVNEALLTLWDSDFAQENLAIENYMTLPFPLLEEGVQKLVASFGSKSPAGSQECKIYPPFLSAEILYPSFDASWKRVTPEDFGLVLAADGSLGNLDDQQKKMSELSVEGYGALKKHYYQLLSTVLEYDWLTRAGSDHLQRTVAQEVKMILGDLLEDALRDYYNQVGGELNEWIVRQGV